MNHAANKVVTVQRIHTTERAICTQGSDLPGGLVCGDVMIMYWMADRWYHVYFNLSNVYITGMMAGSMLPIMRATMPGMFKNRKMNAALWLASVAVLALFWVLLRAETGVGDQQFMRAMIPHHSAAIQMCKESSLADPRVRKLCEEIISSQKREIAEMKSFLAEKK